jgi:UDP-glucose 4-epimerase
LPRVLVTGAAGLLGSRLVRRLVARGHDVTAVVRPGAAASLPRGQGRVIERDLRSWAGEELAATDALVYLAQSRRYREFPDGATEVLDVNVRGPLAFAENARRIGARQIIYASTGTVYAPSFETLSETSPVEPEGFYGRSKACAERLLRSFEDTLDVKILRPFFLFGPGQRDSMTIPTVVGRVLRGEEVTLRPRPGDAAGADCDGLRFQWIDADDAAECVARLIDAPGSFTVNLAGDEASSIRGVAELAGREAGVEPRFAVSRESRQGDLLADNAALRARLGPFAFRSLAESLGALVRSTLERSADGAAASR